MIFENLSTCIGPYQIRRVHGNYQVTILVGDKFVILENTLIFELIILF